MVNLFKGLIQILSHVYGFSPPSDFSETPFIALLLYEYSHVSFIPFNYTSLKALNIFWT